MRFVLMIEGQEGVSWDEWVALARACEEHGLEGLFRSDHYQSVFDVSGRGSLDAWATLAGLAAVTERIRLGHDGLAGDLPASVGARADGRDRRPHLGRPRRARARRRLEPGEHDAHGFPFPGLASGWRSSRSSSRSCTASGRRTSSRSRGATTGSERCRAEPKPLQQPHPPIVMGGARRAARRGPRGPLGRRVQHPVRVGGGVPRAPGRGSPRRASATGGSRSSFSLMARAASVATRPRCSSVPGAGWSGAAATTTPRSCSSRTTCSSAPSTRSSRDCGSTRDGRRRAGLPPAPRPHRPRHGAADRRGGRSRVRVNRVAPVRGVD